MIFYSKKRLFSYFLLFVTTICWGSTLVIVKPALELVTPFRLLFYRYVLALAFTLPIIIYYWPKVKKPFRALKIAIPIELIGTTLALSCLYIGLQQSGAVESALIVATQPLFITAFGVLLLREKLEGHELGGTILAFLGAIVLGIKPVWDHLNNLSGSWGGNLLVVAQNLAAAIQFLLAKKYYHPYPKFFIVSLGYFVGLISFGLLALAESGCSLTNLINQISHDVTQPVIWGAALFLAIVASIIGLTAYIKGQDGIETSEASIFWYLQPLVSMPLGVIILRETVNWIDLVGLGMIIVGVIWATERFRSGKIAHRRTP